MPTWIVGHGVTVTAWFGTNYFSVEQREEEILLPAAEIGALIEVLQSAKAFLAGPAYPGGKDADEEVHEAGRRGPLPGAQDEAR